MLLFIKKFYHTRGAFSYQKSKYLYKVFNENKLIKRRILCFEREHNFRNCCNLILIFIATQNGLCGSTNKKCYLYFLHNYKVIFSVYKSPRTSYLGKNTYKFNFRSWNIQSDIKHVLNPYIKYVLDMFTFIKKINLFKKVNVNNQARKRIY